MTNFVKTLSLHPKVWFPQSFVDLFFSKCIHHAKVRHCFTQQFLASFSNMLHFFFVKCKIISLFFWSCERLWHLIPLCGFKFYRIHQDFTCIRINFKISSAYSKIWHIFVWSNEFDPIVEKEDILYFIKLIWWKKNDVLKKIRK